MPNNIQEPGLATNDKQKNETTETSLTDAQIDLAIQHVITKNTKTKKCPFCKWDIDKKAIRCNHCCCFINHPFLIKSLISIWTIIGRWIIISFIISIIAIILLILGIYSFSTTWILPDISNILPNISNIINSNALEATNESLIWDNYSWFFSEILSSLDSIQNMQNSIWY